MSDNDRVQAISGHMRVDVPPGSHLEWAIDEIIRLARVHNTKVVAAFNGVDLSAIPGMSFSTVEYHWSSEMEMRRRAVELRKRNELAINIQLAIEDEAKNWPSESSFYSPSPGHTWSHVAYRIAQVVMKELDDRG